MFNNVNLNNLSNFSIDELDQTVSNIATHIENNLDFKVEESCLKILYQTRDNPLSLEVLDGLRKITQVVLEKGLHGELEVQLQVISNLCKEIIVSHPNSQIAENYNPEILCKVLSYLNPKELESISTVDNFWKGAIFYNQIKAINENKLKLWELLKGYTAKEAVDFVIDHCGKNFHHADFSGFENFDNNCLEKLTKNCPQLTFLSISKSIIQKDALKNLEYIPQLLSLNIADCNQLDADALKNLQYTKHLQALNIFNCKQLEADALKNIQHTQQLQYLNLACCSQLGTDALKNLQYTKELQRLNIFWCPQLEIDALKNLQYTPQLQLRNLNINKCPQLDQSFIPKNLKF